MRSAPEVIIPEHDAKQLKKWANGHNTPTRLRLRSKIVLLSGEGLQNKQIAEKLGIVDPTARKWRNRYIDRGLHGIEHDAARPGRPKTIDDDVERRIVEESMVPPLNRTHWSVRLMAEHVGVNPSYVHYIWKKHDLKPHKVRRFKLSKDPRFEEKLEDVVGLYMDPPENALVFSVDEKSQMQALDRSQPILPIRKGLPEHQAYDYRRHGTATLFAALNVQTGEVISELKDRARHMEFIEFLETMDDNTPAGRELHVILDNLSAHKTAEVKQWLSEHERFHLHFIPTSSSWLNVVERLFRDLSEQRLKRGVFKSVDDLVQAVEGWLDERNKDSKPVKWTKTVEEILRKVNKYKRIYQTLH